MAQRQAQGPWRGQKVSRKAPCGLSGHSSQCFGYETLDSGHPRCHPRPMCRDLAVLRFSGSISWTVDARNIFFEGDPEDFSENVFLALLLFSGFRDGFHRKDRKKLVWKKPRKYWIELQRVSYVKNGVSTPLRPRVDATPVALFISAEILFISTEVSKHNPQKILTF